MSSDVMKEFEGAAGLHGGHSVAYTTGDGVTRTFRALFWPDMLRLGPLFGKVRADVPWLNYLQPTKPKKMDEGPEMDLAMESYEGYQALIEIVSTLFGEKYCDQPLTREQIEKEAHIDMEDLQELMQIGLGLAGLEKKLMAAGRKEQIAD